MKINRLNWLLAMMTAAALTTVSCNKNEALSPEPQPVPGTKVDICITGDFNDLETKAEIKNIFRMTWSATDTATVKDTVIVYGKSGGSFAVLGKLAASPVEDTENRVADLKGTITEPDENTRLTLVYSSFGEEPIYESDKVSINLIGQDGEDDSVMFVAYASVEYDGTTTSSYRTSFKFATNVLRVNVSGLEAGSDVESARIDSIETMCQLTLKADAVPTISGTTINTIDRNLDNFTANDKGRAAFYVAVPVFTACANRELSVEVCTDTLYGISRIYRYPAFATGAQATGGNALNSIAAIPTPIEYKGGTFNYGYGTFIPETGVIWAPVNCGYSDTTKYGLLYQFGRTAGSGYNDGSTFTEKAQTSTAATYDGEGFNKNPKDDEFYSKNSFPFPDWYTTTNNHLPEWPMKAPDGTTGIGNPCPDGWRVPTATELVRLFGDETGMELEETAVKDGQYGVWLDGTGNNDATSGVFFSFAGVREQYGVNAGEYRGVKGAGGMYANYWSSTYTTGSYPSVLCLWFGMVYGYNYQYAAVQTDHWSNGNSVRCVQK